MELPEPLVLGVFMIMAIFVLFFGIFALFLIGVGIAVGIALLTLAGALTFFGIISASTLFGILTRSPSAGFRVLFLQLGAAAGIPLGIGAACLWTYLFDENLRPMDEVLLGAMVGLGGGLVAALAFNYGWTRALRVILPLWAPQRTNHSGKRS